MSEPSSPAAPVVRVHAADGITTITLDSQPNRNALSRQLVSELGAAIDAAHGARVIVLRHAGPAFCSGADLKERADPTQPLDSTLLVDVMRSLLDAPCPTIAAVTGAVRAGGVGLMASCDLVVVASSVTFALTEVRLGVAPAIIAVPILRRVASSAIAPAMLTGEPFDAHEARRIGLVTHVTDDVDGTVSTLTQALLAGAPQAVAETKRLLRRVPTLPRDEAFAEMRALSDSLFRSPEAVEGMAAFRERRPPEWPDQANNR